MVFIKQRDLYDGKSERIIFGIRYAENSGFPFPLPFISWYKKFHPKWSYDLGIPRTNFQYHLSEKHRFKLYAGLAGFSSNIQNGTVLKTGEVAERINLSLILGGLQYEYHFTDHLQLFARAA